MSELIEITGFKELEAKIRLLANDKDKKSEVLLILRQIAEPTLRAARSYAPVSRKNHQGRRDKAGKMKIIESGNLRKSLGYIKGRQENPTIYVGARAKGSNDGWYAHFVEKGHRIFNQRTASFTRSANGRFVKNTVSKTIRGNKKGAISQGMSKVSPFMAPAYEQTQGQVTAEAEKKVAAFIQRRINKLSNV